MKKNLVQKIYNYIVNPDYRFIINESLGLYKNIDDVTFTKRKFKIRMGYELNLENPITFNEKLQWLKLFDHNPIYTKMVDKIGAKEYAANILGEKHIIPTIGIWDKPEDIDWDKLPKQFVLKVTHDSGGIVICKDKEHLDKEAVIKILSKSLDFDYYKLHREWPYKNVPRKIIAEKYMKENGSEELRDYKFYCFNGEPQFLYVSEGLSNHKNAKMCFVTLDWDLAKFGRFDYTPYDKLPPKPNNLDDLIIIARKLSKGYTFLRVDLYSINGNIYFGELTLCPCAGMMRFDPEEYDKIVGEFMSLPYEKIGVDYGESK